MKHKQAPTELALFAVVVAGLIISLHQLGSIEGMRVEWSDPIDWFSTASAEDAIGATLRSIGLVIGYWIALSALLYGAAAIRRPHKPRAISLITLPFVRRMLDRTLATALAASVAITPLAPAMAQEVPPPPVVFQADDGIPVPHIVTQQEGTHLDTPATTTIPAASMPVVSPPQLREPAVSPPVIAATTTPTPTTAIYTGYTVQPGDNLWAIAESFVTSTTGDTPTVGTITSYWRQLVDENRNTLRSGDPNLIFAGEIITMPAVEVSP